MATMRIINRNHENAQNPPQDPQGIRMYQEASAFLWAASSKAREVLGMLDSTNKTYNLFVRTDPGIPARNWENCWMPMERLPSALRGSEISTTVSCIRWWANPGDKRTGKRSAALALLHELGHEYQWLKFEREMREWKIWQPHIQAGRAIAWKKKGRAAGRLYSGFRSQSARYVRQVEDWVVRVIETPAANQINDYHRAGRHKPNDIRRDDRVYVQHLEPTRAQYLAASILDRRWIDTVADPRLRSKFGRPLA